MRGKGREGGCSLYTVSATINSVFCSVNVWAGSEYIVYYICIPKHNVFISSSIIYATCVYNLRDFVFIYFNTFTRINIFSDISNYMNKNKLEQIKNINIYLYLSECNCNCLHKSNFVNWLNEFKCLELHISRIIYLSYFRAYKLYKQYITISLQILKEKSRQYFHFKTHL